MRLWERQVARGAHPAFADLAERFPIQDRKLLTRLGRVLSALAQARCHSAVARYPGAAPLNVLGVWMYERRAS